MSDNEIKPSEELMDGLRTLAEKDLERELKFARLLHEPQPSPEFLKEAKKFSTICNRTLRSRFKKLWRIYYRIMPARWTGI